jgi:elongation factor Ts
MAEITAAQVKELRDKTGAGFGDCKAALGEANGNIEEAVKILRKKGLAAASKKAGRITSEGLVHIVTRDNVAVLVEVNSETDFVAQNAEFRALVDGIGQVIAQSKASSVEELASEKWPDDPENHTVSEVLATNIGKIGENISIRRFIRFEAAEDELFGSYIHGNGKIGVLVQMRAGNGKEQAAATAKDVAMHAAAAEPRFLTRDEVTEQDLATEREIARDQAIKSGKPENIVEKMVEGKMEKFYGEAVLLEQSYIRDEKLTVKQLVQQRGKEAGAEFEIVRFARYRVGEGLQKREENFAAEVMAQVQR